MAGTFADPAFPPPERSSYEVRRHPWVGLPDTMERDHLWAQVQPLYEAGDYAAAADLGRSLLEQHPGQGRLAYNVACCESMAGRSEDAIAHLRLAIDAHGDLRTLAAEDPDLEPIRGEPGFRELVG
jgi:hypothetical protein